MHTGKRRAFWRQDADTSPGQAQRERADPRGLTPNSDADPPRPVSLCVKWSFCAPETRTGHWLCRAAATRRWQPGPRRGLAGAADPHQRQASARGPHKRDARTGSSARVLGSPGEHVPNTHPNSPYGSWGRSNAEVSPPGLAEACRSQNATRESRTHFLSRVIVNLKTSSLGAYRTALSALSRQVILVRNILCRSKGPQGCWQQRVLPGEKPHPGCLSGDLMSSQNPGSIRGTCWCPRRPLSWPGGSPRSPMLTWASTLFAGSPLPTSRGISHLPFYPCSWGDSRPEISGVSSLAKAACVEGAEPGRRGRGCSRGRRNRPGASQPAQRSGERQDSRHHAGTGCLGF